MKLKVGNPWLIFSPFLAIFILLVLKLHSDKMEGDESRYIMYAQNLLQGFYSPKNVVFLWMHEQMAQALHHYMYCG